MNESREQRVVLRAFESARRPTWRALWQNVVGVGAELVIIGAFAGAGWLERWWALRQVTVDEGVAFIAPSRQAVPPPAEERLSFLGLGDALVASSGETAPPKDNGTKAVARTPGGNRLIADDENLVQPESNTQRALTEIEVDSAAALDPSAVGPEYPPELMRAGVQGVVYAQFVVDSVGMADTLSLEVLQTVEPQFVVAVKNALPNMKYKPAMFAGRRVNQLVQQAFVFRIKPGG